MASTNQDSLMNQGQFHARVPPSQSVAGKWHRPGDEQGNDAAPEFHAKTYAPGTAPKESSFQPNPISEAPGQANNPDMHPEARTDALADMPGSTDKEIYNRTDFQHGRPMQGMESREEHGAHPRKRKAERSGLEGVGASARGQESVERKVRHTATDRDEAAKGQRGKTGAVEGGYDWSGSAENTEPVSAESADIGRRK